MEIRAFCSEASKPGLVVVGEGYGGIRPIYEPGGLA